MPEITLLPAQIEFMNSTHDYGLDVALYQGGYGSLSGNAEFEDLATGQTYTMLDLYKQRKGITVKAVDVNGCTVQGQTTPPVLEGVGSLYLVELENGCSIEANAEHRFLTSSGWKKLKDLKTQDSIVVDTPILDVPCAVAHVQLLSEQLDCQDGYLKGQSRCDELPHPSVGSDLVYAQQQLYTASCSAHEHLYSSLSHPHHKRNCLDTHPFYAQNQQEEDQYSYSSVPTSEHSLPLYQGQLLFPGMSSLAGSSQLSSSAYVQDTLENGLFCESLINTSTLDFSNIKSITYLKEDCYYDIHVPKLNNYFSGGVLHHNSGKTFSGSLLGLMLCMKYPGIRGLVGAKTFDQVSNTTYRLGWKEHIKRMGFKEGRDYTYNKTEKILEFSNGSYVNFRHFEEPDKLRSIDVGFIEIEEMSLIPEATFLELFGRLRQSELPDGTQLPKRRLFGHTNPEAHKGWIWKYFVDRTPNTVSYDSYNKPFDYIGAGERRTGSFRTTEKLVKDTDSDELIMYRMVIAPTTQNIFLPPSYVANMRAVFDPDNYKINVLGEFGDYSRGLVVKGFNRAKQLRTDLYIDRNSPIHLTMDFNKDPMCWCIAQKDTNCIYFMDEIVVEHTYTDECINIFMNRYPPDSYPVVILNGDATGQNGHSSAEQANLDQVEGGLNRAGYRVRKDIPRDNPNGEWRIESWNAMMCNSDGVHRIFFAAYETSEGELVPKTPRLIDDIENFKYKAGTSEPEKPTSTRVAKDTTNSLKFRSHSFEAASYMSYYYFPISKYTGHKVFSRPVQNRDPRFNLTGEMY